MADISELSKTGLTDGGKNANPPVEDQTGVLVAEKAELTDTQVKLLQAVKDTAVEQGFGAERSVFTINVARQMGAEYLLTATPAISEKLVVLEDMGYVKQNRDGISWYLTPKGLSVVT